MVEYLGKGSNSLVSTALNELCKHQEAYNEHLSQNRVWREEWKVQDHLYKSILASRSKKRKQAHPNGMLSLSMTEELQAMAEEEQAIRAARDKAKSRITVKMHIHLFM